MSPGARKSNWSPPEAFFMRIARPLPRILVLGRDAPAIGVVLEDLGADTSVVEPDRQMGNLAFADDSFDAIWAGAYFSHVAKADAAAAAASLHQLLRAGGLFGAIVGESEQHPTHWSPRELQELLDPLDLDLLKVTPAGKEFHLTFRREY